MISADGPVRGLSDRSNPGMTGKFVSIRLNQEGCPFRFAFFYFVQRPAFFRQGIRAETGQETSNPFNEFLRFLYE